MRTKKEGTATSNPKQTTNTNINNDVINFKLLKRLVANAGTIEQKVIRVYRVTQGNISAEVRLSSGDLTRQATLEERLLDSGREFHNTETLSALKRKLKQADDGSAITINEVEGLGYIPSFNCWVFSNYVLNDKGELLTPDKDNNCYILNNGERIVKKEGKYKKAVINIDPDTKKIKELIQNVLDARNGDISFILMLGFIYASIKSNLIYDKYGYFPILFVSGDRSSGKSSLIELALSSVGYNGPGDSSTGTANGSNRVLSSTFSLPYWVDEYRNDSHGKKHEANIRRIYDRQTRTTAIKSTDSQTKTEEINGTFILSGQAEIVDTATRSRLIAIQLKGKDKTNPELFQSVDTQDGRNVLSGLARLMIGNRNIDDKELLKRFDDTRKLLQKELIGGVADVGRLSSNYALAYVFSGLLLELVGIDQDEIELYKKIVGIMLKEKEIADGIDTIADLFTCATNPEMLNSKSGWLIAKKDDLILLKSEAITLYKEHKKRIDEPVTLDTNAIRELLKAKVNATSKTVSIANDKQRYWTFPLDSETVSRYEILNDVKEAISERS